MPKSPATLLGRRLRAARERAGLAQDRLGVLIGLDEGSSSARISRYETGAHEPTFAVAEKLATTLGVPAVYLYCDDDQLAELLLVFAKLPTNQRQAVFSYVRSLVRGGEQEDA